MIASAQYLVTRSGADEGQRERIGEYEGLLIQHLVDCTQPAHGQGGIAGLTWLHRESLVYRPCDGRGRTSVSGSIKVLSVRMGIYFGLKSRFCTPKRDLCGGTGLGSAPAVMEAQFDG